jgi:tetratricopeptide (TPR) repeat protein
LRVEAATLALRAEARLARGDAAGAQQALEDAVAADPRYLVARRMLASAFDAAGDSARAVEQYRAILTVRPDDAVVINNLAYALAVGLGRLQEALPFAQKAYKLGSGSPEIIDTLGWVQHLLANDAEAARLFSELLKQEVRVGMIHLHAAIVFEAVGRTSDATRALDRAFALAPELTGDEDAVGLQRKLKW